MFVSFCMFDFLMGINPFVRKWKNLVLYACGGFFLTLIVSYVFLCFLRFNYPLFDCCFFIIFCCQIFAQ